METTTPDSNNQASPVKTLSQERLDRQARTNLKLAEPDLLEVICDNVACGGSVVDLCATWDVHYHKIVQWVYDKNFPGRKDAYEAALTSRLEWTKARICEELKSIGLADIRGAYDDQGNLKDMKDMPAELARVIAGVDVNEEFQTVDGQPEKIGTTKKIKLWDKLRALELLGKNLSMFRDAVDHNVSGRVTLEDMVAGSQPPAAPAPAAAAPAADTTANPEKTTDGGSEEI